MEFQSDNGIKYKIIKQIGEGGQGYVLKVEDENFNHFALKVYKEKHQIDTQKNIIKSLVGHKPKSNNRDIEFIWPIDTIDSISKYFGYVMPLYDNKQYIHYNKVINQRIKAPTLKSLAYLSLLTVEALHSIHKNGMAYCDINMGNIQFDLQHNKIVVCDNDNVVLNNSDVNILGVPEFMAPEVALGKSKPNNISDLYSLSILLYTLWFYEHPMEGKKIEDIKCWDLVAKKKFYHKEPLFVHHPTNKVNSIENMLLYQLSYARWKVFAPRRMKEEFTKTFTEGITQPQRRTKTSSWRKLFIEIMSNTINCPACGTENIFDPDGDLKYCAKCKKEFPPYSYLDINQLGSHMRLVITEGQSIFPYHFGDYTDINSQKPLGIIEKHPKKQGAFIIRNLSSKDWDYEIEDKKYKIEPQKARAIINHSKLVIDGVILYIKI